MRLQSPSGAKAAEFQPFERFVEDQAGMDEGHNNAKVTQTFPSFESVRRRSGVRTNGEDRDRAQ
jgi:hypothetical protein